jgi:polyferredoxin
VKKTLNRRLRPDHSQAWRLALQIAFAAVNVWIGVQFWLWVRFYESGGTTVSVSRPAGVEGWLPIAALMNLKRLIVTGEVAEMHAAGMFLLIAFLGVSLLLRKAFCSWLCPVGTLSEMLWKLGRDVFRKNWKLPRWLDIPLRSLKYVLLGLFLYAVGSMSAEAIAAFLAGPYGMVADVKMLNLFRKMTTATAITIGFLLIASVFVQNFWCRYLCPYGALMGLASLLSPARIRRDPEPCIDCGKCAKACPSLLPVDQLVQIRSAECTGCMECVAVCPAEGALALTLPRKRRVPGWAVAAATVTLFLSVYGYAQYMGYWNTHLPKSVYFRLIPNADDFGHP